MRSVSFEMSQAFIPTARGARFEARVNALPHALRMPLCALGDVVVAACRAADLVPMLARVGLRYYVTLVLR